MGKAVRIFISYAHQDDYLRERLRVHLSQLERDGLVKAWDDREIPAGEQWADEIDERLESADIILLLVSADFIHSNFCYGKEMRRAIERHEEKKDRAVLIPVILRKCDWKTAPFSRFQALPSGVKPISEWKTEDDYFEAVTEGLRKRIQQLVTSEAEGLVRRRDPKWWERPRVRWALLSMAVVVCLVTWWWLTASAAVDQEIRESLVALREGRYSDAKHALERTSKHWVGLTRVGEVLKKAELGVTLEAEENAIPVEQFAGRVAALLKENPKDPDLLFFAGTLAQRNQQNVDAITKFTEATERAPWFPEAYFNWGSLLLSRRDYPGALAVLEKAVEEAPFSSQFQNAVAYARLRTSDIKGAEDAYRKSVANGSILSRLELAQLLWLSGRFQEARDQQLTALNELSGGNLASKGHNRLPWSFDLESGAIVTLNHLREKICYARLSWLASRAMMSESVQPDMGDCGPSGSYIAQAVCSGSRRIA
jgi:tetratricopeptide (TPR) repeat protein